MLWLRKSQRLQNHLNLLRRKGINSEWAALSHAVIERAAGESRQRLCACVHAGGEHFKHML